MAVPKRRLSRSRRDARRANWKLAPKALVPCPRCKQLHPPHHVCANCGYYDGREVVAVD